MGEYCDDHVEQARAEYAADAVGGKVAQTDVGMHNFPCVKCGKRPAPHRLMYQKKR